MNIKKIYKHLFSLQVIFACIPPLLLVFFKIDVFQTYKIMSINPIKLSIKTLSIFVMGYELFSSVFLAKFLVFVISLIIFLIRKKNNRTKN
jgi:hypothetical protein